MPHNQQPYNEEGYYLHYKQMLYKVLGFGFDNNSEKPAATLIIYQPQYDSFEFGKNMLWVKPTDMFFEDVEINGIITPRFKYMEKTKENVERILKNEKINTSKKTIYKTESMLDKKIAELVFPQVTVRAFARHSEDPSDIQVIYNMEKAPSIFSIISAKKFFDTYNINRDNQTIAKYLKETEK